MTSFLDLLITILIKLTWPFLLAAVVLMFTKSAVAKKNTQFLGFPAASYAFLESTAWNTFLFATVDGIFLYLITLDGPIIIPLPNSTTIVVISALIMASLAAGWYFTNTILFASVIASVAIPLLTSFPLPSGWLPSVMLFALAVVLYTAASSKVTHPSPPKK